MFKRVFFGAVHGKCLKSQTGACLEKKNHLGRVDFAAFFKTRAAASALPLASLRPFSHLSIESTGLDFRCVMHSR